MALYLLLGWLAVGPLLKWAAPKWLSGRGGYTLAIEQAHFNPLALSLELQGLSLKTPQGQPLLGLGRLYVNFQASSLFRRAWTFNELLIEQPTVAVTLLADGRLNWQLFVDALADKAQPAPPPDPTAEPPRLLVQRLALSDGRIDFSDQQVSGGFSTQLAPLALELDDVSTLPNAQGEHEVTAHVGLGADLHWQGRFGLNPLVSSGEFSIQGLPLGRLWPYLQQRLKMAPPEGQASLSLHYEAAYAQRQLSLKLAQVNAKLAEVALRGTGQTEPAVALGALTLSGGTLDLASRHIGVESLALQGGALHLVRAVDGRLDLQDWFAAAPAAAAPPAPAPAASAPAEPWTLQLARASVEGLGLRLEDRGLATPLMAELGELKLGFQAEASTAGDGQFKLQGLQLSARELALRSGAAEPWFKLAGATLSDGQLDLAERTLGIGRVAFAGGQLVALRDAQGELSLLTAFKPAAAKAAVAAPAPAASAPAWHYRIDQVAASDWQATLRDEAVPGTQPLVLEGIQGQVEQLSDDPKARLPVQLALAVQGNGGRLSINGQVQPASQAADLRVSLRGLALAPAKPYLAQQAAITLLGGLLDAEGRLRLSQGQPRYEGKLALRELRIDETVSGERFLAWRQLNAPRLVVTPQSLEAGDVDLDGLNTKLVIFKDRSINLTKVLRPQAVAAAAPAASAASAMAATKVASPAAAPAFLVDVSRVRVRDSELDFADLSLALPFAARIHGLQGQLAGLSTRPGRSAQIELGGQVDEYGLARASGQVELGNPTNAMDIGVVFKNVEMTSLTPYAATFAGRRIASGKLSLDLAYKIAKRQLRGENQVVMDKLTLGEKVDSPTAVNLPLDLALALLQDSDGRIDLGLPISGSLDDPQFSYGGIVWKAIVNVLTKVVTAPFRAIGALFGGGDDEAAPRIAFDPGHAELPPPEREKLDQLAQALAKRPGLAVKISAGYSLQADTAALQDLWLRQAVAAQRKQEVAPGELPGAVNLTQPEVRQALEAIYTQRLGGPALEALRQQIKAAAAKPAEPARTAEAKPPEFPLHAALQQQLMAQSAVTEDQLTALATSRAEAVSSRLISRNVPQDRLLLVAPKRLDAEQASQVELGLSVKASPAVEAASSAAAR
ncbi:DUF748 domain-containing protein [Ideonella azotifigens]|uniref:DUF748 domain-containing protein n=2 Tax=Ideonella azotifigens TaxID=513160 RepID=A0ABP3VQ85_9BURK